MVGAETLNKASKNSLVALWITALCSVMKQIMTVDRIIITPEKLEKWTGTKLTT